MICFAIQLAFAFLMTNCGKQMDGPVERSWGRMEGLIDIVGNMDDASYSQGRQQKPRMSAADIPVHITDFEGQFVWSEYVASWCAACAQQTPQTQKAEAELGSHITFLTVLTSKSLDFNDHATIDTAKAWAGKFGLDPKQVVAAQLWAKTIPEHRFFSPEGHLLFVHVGFLSADQIKQVISHYESGWQAWKETGEPADWMRETK